MQILHCNTPVYSSHGDAHSSGQCDAVNALHYTTGLVMHCITPLVMHRGALIQCTDSPRGIMMHYRQQLDTSVWMFASKYVTLAAL